MTTNEDRARREALREWLEELECLRVECVAPAFPRWKADECRHEAERYKAGAFLPFYVPPDVVAWGEEAVRAYLLALAEFVEAYTDAMGSAVYAHNIGFAWDMTHGELEEAAERLERDGAAILEGGDLRSDLPPSIDAMLHDSREKIGRALGSVYFLERARLLRALAAQGGAS